ncbi:hypothetical protein E3Q16_04463 [Wallemia mellicola]|nr:hypothetical protein E3Q16_04463 [Wallemia mellicola]
MQLSWNLSPLQSSRFSLEYLLLPPRSALETVPLNITVKASIQSPRLPTRLVHSAADSDFHGHRPAV